MSQENLQRILVKTL